MQPEQIVLSGEQLEAFYHDEFVQDQLRDFQQLLGSQAPRGTVKDIGGGCGFFARQLAERTGRTVKVIDADPASIATCRAAGIDAEVGDALQPRVEGNEDVVCFNLILHHLVGGSERLTRELQQRALSAWRSQARALFVNEYIYESYLPGLSGRLIYEVTKSRILSGLARMVAVLVPSLKANTFGVGVRFRDRHEWLRLFAAAGYDSESVTTGPDEPVSLPRRLLLIKRIRRDSFLLRPRLAG
jgi:SAM-dependent methyltransferase